MIQSYSASYTQDFSHLSLPFLFFKHKCFSVQPRRANGPGTLFLGGASPHDLLGAWGPLLTWEALPEGGEPWGHLSSPREFVAQRSWLLRLLGVQKGWEQGGPCTPGPGNVAGRLGLCLKQEAGHVLHGCSALPFCKGLQLPSHSVLSAV